jgi:hypothetical protein
MVSACSAFDLSTQRLIDIKKIKTFNSLTNLSSIYIMLVKSMTTHKEENLQHGSIFFFLIVTCVIILLVLTWHINGIRQVL